MKPLVPSNPGPPKDPKSFWAPWPAIREPCTTRTIVGAVSFNLEVYTLTPSVDIKIRTPHIPQDHPVYTSDLPSGPLQQGPRKGGAFTVSGRGLALRSVHTPSGPQSQGYRKLCWYRVPVNRNAASHEPVSSTTRGFPLARE